jgi:hypothetical protein
MYSFGTLLLDLLSGKHIPPSHVSPSPGQVCFDTTNSVHSHNFFLHTFFFPTNTNDKKKKMKRREEKKEH